MAPRAADYGSLSAKERTAHRLFFEMGGPLPEHNDSDDTTKAPTPADKQSRDEAQRAWEQTIVGLPFLSFPLEVREMIYRLCITTEQEVHFVSAAIARRLQRGTNPEHRAIFRVNRAINAEISTLFWNSADIVVSNPQRLLLFENIGAFEQRPQDGMQLPLWTYPTDSYLPGYVFTKARNLRLEFNLGKIRSLRVYEALLVLVKGLARLIAQSRNITKLEMALWDVYKISEFGGDAPVVDALLEPFQHLQGLGNAVSRHDGRWRAGPQPPSTLVVIRDMQSALEDEAADNTVEE